MIKILNITVIEHILKCIIIGDNGETYHMTCDLDTKYFNTISSDIPEEFKMYERQARMALLEYKGKTFPKEIEYVWY